MRYYKIIEDEYIVAIGTGPGDIEIDKSEYDQIAEVIRNGPTPPDGYGYKLRLDLTWEEYVLPVMPETDEISDEEALDIITGVSE